MKDKCELAVGVVMIGLVIFAVGLGVCAAYTGLTGDPREVPVRKGACAPGQLYLGVELSGPRANQLIVACAYSNNTVVWHIEAIK